MNQILPIIPEDNAASWQFNPQKVKAMDAYQDAMDDYDKRLQDEFPNHEYLHPIFDNDYPRLKAWHEKNPRPYPPFCRHCGHDLPPEEKRWCCNPTCDHYLL